VLGEPRDVTPSGAVRDEPLDGITWQVPQEWTRRAPSSSMRAAEFLLPGPGGDVELVAFRFPGGAGPRDANLARWRGQMTAPDGSPLAPDAGQSATVERDGLTLTTLTLDGTFAGSGMGPGGQARASDQRLIAAIIEGSGDAVYLKAVGPVATLDVWTTAWTKALESVRAATPAG
jgi:hypothetical protein